MPRRLETDMIDNVATLAGFTREVFGGPTVLTFTFSSTRKPTWTIVSRLGAAMSRSSIKVNGWLFSFEDVEENVDASH